MHIQPYVKGEYQIKGNLILMHAILFFVKNRMKKLNMIKNTFQRLNQIKAKFFNISHVYHLFHTGC